MVKEKRVIISDEDPTRALTPSVAATASTPNGFHLEKPSEPKLSLFDPSVKSLIKDRTFQALTGFKWSDRQSHGRLVYDTMMKHAAVSAPFNTLVSFLKAYRPLFKPAGTDPTPRQKEFAAFANEQLRRLAVSGDGRQSYEKFIEWIGQGLRYGFAIGEMQTTYAPWNGQRRIQIQRFLPLPQASLDHGFNPLEEFGQGIMSTADVRYDCIRLDSSGAIKEVVQYGHGGDNQPQTVSWTEAELLHLLIYTHGGTEGNPYGESILYSAFYHWSSLYTLEQMEEAMLDAGLPYLTASYKTPDGRPSAALHQQFVDVIKNQDPTVRALIMPDTTFGSTAPSNPAFTEHATSKKQELRRYILNCIFGIPVMQGEAANELDARNAIQVFFKYLVPALQREISTLLTWQFARRFIDANWSNVSQDEYPECTFQNTLDNDLRVSMPMLQQILPFVDSERTGEFLQTMVPNFDGTWIPKSHKDSFMEQRAPTDPAAGAKSTPPVKQEGTPDSRHDGTTSNVGQQVNSDT